MNDLLVEAKYRMLVDAATEVLRKNYHPVKHSVGAAVLCASGQIYVGVNIESSGHGVCAEPIALGAALSHGEREILAVVAVANRGDGCIVLSPCGNCRQTLLDYAPEADVIYARAGGVAQAKAKDLLPGAYVAPDFDSI
jgi:cytidine deaminase